MALSERRHHYQRRKKATIKLWKSLGWNIDKFPNRVGIYANTRKPCSCFICGNPRRKLGELTLQEKKIQLVNPKELA